MPWTEETGKKWACKTNWRGKDNFLKTFRQSAYETKFFVALCERTFKIVVRVLLYFCITVHCSWDISVWTWANILLPVNVSQFAQGSIIICFIRISSRSTVDSSSLHRDEVIQDLKQKVFNVESEVLEKEKRFFACFEQKKVSSFFTFTNPHHFVYFRIKTYGKDLLSIVTSDNRSVQMFIQFFYIVYLQLQGKFAIGYKVIYSYLQGNLQLATFDICHFLLVS